MSDRLKPSDYELLASLEAGEILKEITPAERLLKNWQENTYRGPEILKIPPQRWTVPGWIASDSLTVVYAAPGVGKSFYALSLAIEMARGGEWVGTKLEPVPVLYLAGERLTTLRDRAEAWSTKNREPLPENLLMPKLPSPPQLTNPSHVETICQFIRSEEVQLVVIDTYAMMTQGIEENSSKDTGEVMGALSQIRDATDGGSVLMVHHSGKDSSKGARGSTAMMAAVDLSIEIASGGNGRISATVRKSNAGEKPFPEWYELEMVVLEQINGEHRSSAVLKATGIPKRDESLEHSVLEILRNSSNNSMSKPEILEAIKELGREVSRAHLDRTALKPLMEQGTVRMDGKARAARYSLSESMNNYLLSAHP
jgi:hypothetical protein